MLAEVTSRAAAESVSYLELMLSPDGNVSARLGRESAFSRDFAQMRSRLLAADFNAVFTQAKQRLDSAEARRNELQHCGTPAAEPGCGVTVRYISQVLRAGPPEQVFAQILAGFELATRDPRITGVNLVQPEDDPVAVRDFSLHLAMIDFLRRAVPVRPGCAARRGDRRRAWCRPRCCAFTSANRSRRGTRCGSATAWT